MASARISSSSTRPRAGGVRASFCPDSRGRFAITASGTAW